MKVSVRIFDESQRDYLEGAIRLCKPKLLGDWEFSSAAEADVLFMSPQDPGVDVFISKFLNSKDKIPVIYADRNNTVSPWFVKRRASKDELVQFLNSIYTTLTAEKQNKTDSALAPGEGDLLSHTIELDRKYEGLTGPVRLSGENLAEIYYDPGTKIFYGNGDTDLFLLTKVGSSNCEPVQKSEFKTGLSELMSLAEMKWNLCQLHGAPEGQTEGNLHLEQWPDFTRIIHDAEDMALAAFFTRYVAPASLASTKLGIPAEKVYSFCNAANYAGFLSSSTQTTAKSVQIDSQPSKRSKVIRSIVKLMHGDID